MIRPCVLFWFREYMEEHKLRNVLIIDKIVVFNPTAVEYYYKKIVLFQIYTIEILTRFLEHHQFSLPIFFPHKPIVIPVTTT